MMGTKARLFTPVHVSSLDELVPADHFYRHLDRVLDLSFVRELVQDRYAAGVGRPSVDPVVFFRLALVMFFEGIRILAPSVRKRTNTEPGEEECVVVGHSAMALCDGNH